MKTKANLDPDRCKVVIWLANLLRHRQYVIVGIDGSEGSKSYAEELAEQFSGEVIHIDMFSDHEEVRIQTVQSFLADWIPDADKKHRLCLIEGPEVHRAPLDRYCDLLIRMRGRDEAEKEPDTGRKQNRIEIHI